MSATVKALLEQLRKLSPAEQQEILQQLLHLSPPCVPASSASARFPKVKVSGGTITSQQVAEALDDE